MCGLRREEYDGNNIYEYMSLLLIRGGVNMMIASWLITLSARARFSVDEQSDQMLHAIRLFSFNCICSIKIV
ncbi:hypothetical protein DERF_012832 [Dermatophagoides farinae]|uniref:Uncharacterized protein n=1 Tax=Dermatophagoides farinae TaxID=6954 RepID=A0A922HV02_DERFA|nr:hypothetical protein DERF_012832 [Dermatophagoides farinae]